MSGVSLNRGLEKPLCEDVKESLDFLGVGKDVEDARVMGLLLRKAANKE